MTDMYYVCSQVWSLSLNASSQGQIVPAFLRFKKLGMISTSLTHLRSRKLIEGVFNSCLLFCPLICLNGRGTRIIVLHRPLILILGQYIDSILLSYPQRCMDQSQRDASIWSAPLSHLLQHNIHRRLPPCPRSRRFHSDRCRLSSLA